MQKRRIFYSAFLVAFIITSGLGCKGSPQAALDAAKPVKLEYWSVEHDSAVMTELINRYRAVRPYVSINFRRFRPEEFEKQLLEALAEDRGPDVITLHNTWISKYQTKLLPLPATLSVANVTIKGSQMSPEKIVTVETIPTPSPAKLDQIFVNTVKKDVVRAGVGNKPEILGLPMALDTLVLYYNQDLLDQANVPQPPGSWAELQEAVVAATRYDSEGNIAQAGGAFGTGKNVDRAGDILAALLTQNGAQMADVTGRPTFHLTPEGAQGEEPPILPALRFYADFGDPTKQVYTWNNKMESSFDAFTRGKAAFFFGYAYHIPLLKAKAPKLNYRILSIPQLNPEKPKNVANYWVESVSKKTLHPDEAWDFINFITKEPQAELYTTRTRKPTALRTMITKQLENPDLAPFAAQLLTAESWYRGRDPKTAETAMAEMVDYLHENQARAETTDIFAEAINRTVSKINQSL